MYKDVGKTLKVLAWIIVMMCTCVFMVFGVIVAALTDAPGVVFISIILLFGGIGFVFGQLFGILTYAYGELVDCVSQIKNNLCASDVTSTVKDSIE